MTMQLAEELYSKPTGIGAEFEPYELTPKEKKDWDMTRTALLWSAPSFTHILYSMLDAGKNIAYFTKDIPTMAVDGTAMYVNPEFFFKLPLNQRIFGIAHEVMHCVMDHIGQGYLAKKRGFIPLANGTKLPFIHEVMNVAQDLVINDCLVESKIGELIPGICHDVNTARHSDSSVDVYKKLFNEAKKNGGGQGKQRGNQFDKHLEPGQGQGKDPTQTQQNRSAQAWKTAIAAGQAAAKARGKMPAALDRLFGELLEPQVSWQEKIQAFFARKVGSGSFDWRRPDRRLIVRDIYAPGRSGHGAGTIAVAVDTSGSIGQKELDVFFAELRGIFEDVRPKLLLLIWCDAKVHRVDPITDPAEFRGLKPVGGGGTRFEPVFEWLEENNHEVDALVYLTDGLGSFPRKPPKYNVLWGSIMKDSKYPWGDVIDIPLK